MNKKVVIVDYGLGNLYSIQQACIHLGIDPILSSDHNIISDATSLILPGVGAFGNAMKTLEKLDLKESILDFAKSGKPLMGVCLGMQLLFDESEEFGHHKGLGLISGTVQKFPKHYNDSPLRIPHIGWNKIFAEDESWNDTPLKELKSGDLMYFVHSYFGKPDRPEDVLTKTLYEEFSFCSSVRKNNIFGFQFHPEKSGTQGLSIYKSFLTYQPEMV